MSKGSKKYNFEILLIQCVLDIDRQFDIDSASSQRQIMKRLQERGRLGCKFLRAEVVGFVYFLFL